MSPWISVLGQMSPLQKRSLPGNHCPWQLLGSQERRQGAGEQTAVLSACLLQLLSVEWLCTYLFTLAFKEKCQGKWERMSDSGARHLAPDLQPLCSGSMGYILLAFAPF